MVAYGWRNYKMYRPRRTIVLMWLRRNCGLIHCSPLGLWPTMRRGWPWFASTRSFVIDVLVAQWTTFWFYRLVSRRLCNITASTILATSGWMINGLFEDDCVCTSWPTCTVWSVVNAGHAGHAGHALPCRPRRATFSGIRDAPSFSFCPFRASIIIIGKSYVKNWTTKSGSSCYYWCLNEACIAPGNLFWVAFTSRDALD